MIGTTIPLAAVRATKPCDNDWRSVRATFPHGVPLTITAGDALIAAGVDVPWFLLTLLTPQQRVDFILFTLERRREPIAQLLNAAGLPDHARQVRALTFRTPIEALAAVAVFDASRAASWAASWAASRAASRDASRAASWAASWDASRDASRAAFLDTSRDTSWAASWDASWAAERRAQIRWMLPRLLNSEIARVAA